MARFERCVFAGAIALTAAACNSLAGLGRFEEVPSPDDSGHTSDALDGEAKDEQLSPRGNGDSPESGTGVPDGPTIMDTGTPLDASDDAGDSGVDADASDAMTDAVSPTDRRWARWIMPNNTTDADGGLPNPARYSVTESFVSDTITTLLWMNEPADAATLAAAQAACAKAPWRLPTRIEVVSILDTSQSPTTASPVFGLSPTRKLWTASSTPDGRAWTIDFGSGAVAPSTANSVLCVSGGP